MDDASDDRGMVDYAWDHAIISDELYAAINKECKFANDVRESDGCHLAMIAFYDAFDHIDIYSLYTPYCTKNSTSTSSRAMAKQLRLNNKLDSRLLVDLFLRISCLITSNL